MKKIECANCSQEIQLDDDEDVRDKVRCGNCGYWGAPAKQCPRCYRGTLGICEVNGKTVMGCDECRYYKEIEE